eukprot:CAMPEP_0201119350 /NCGR_PEP_ID=MMETSP0850-20130426/3502_1 /ASSEMBLY_ACC=CAM_ASM_000622 /TAXON_ID=183588 /ORGANISM="Pseudo-nitzschia fraudulenta, Strain WWA7" /LENGTH=234 /DNA_ID=CAMNT_0047385027 /DNA_START=127 /DNA_END=831 /DNA_ORIENTATION=+
MAKAPESSSPSLFPAGNRRSNKRVVTAFVSAIGFLVAVGAIVALTTSSDENEFSPIAKLFADAQCTDPCVPGSEDIMKPKDHGTSDYPVQQDLRWGCDWDTADRISNFNRHYAEYAGYWTSTTFLTDYAKNIEEETGQVTFYDSGWKGSPLFTAPRDRTWDDFIQESIKHGWPSFRDSEVDWEYARVLPGGEMVSVDGTHLGHNLPDKSGNRYCINLVSIAGNVPTDENVRHLL